MLLGLLAQSGGTQLVVGLILLALYALGLISFSTKQDGSPR